MNELRELPHLINRLYDGDLSLEESNHLDAVLRKSPEARRYYYEFVNLHVDLGWTQNDQSPELGSWGQSLKGEPLKRDRHQSRSPILKFKVDFRKLLASRATVWSVLIVGSLFYGGFAILSWDLRSGRLPSGTNGNGSLVATVHHSTDVRWLPTAKPRSDVASIRAGEPLKIKSGTMELELNTGAKLVIEGPADWSVEGNNSVSLRAGKLLARIPQQAIGFIVETPTAKIVDLGTEFGVEVNSSGTTEVNVLKGAVEVNPSNSRSGTSKSLEKKLLVAGQAVRVNHAGVSEVVASSNSAKDALRQDEGRDVTTVDLVDIVAGGDGRGHARDRGISPHDGRIIYVPDKNYGSFAQLSSTGYQHVNDRPLIDGVSIPNPSKGAVQLTSAGHTFDRFPKTNGETWGPIWAAGSVPDARPPIFRTTFDGKLDYGVAPHGAIALHANKLITFDLEAIRRAHPKQRLVRFRSVVGLTKPADRQNESGLADSWVFIDGQMRHNRQAINSSHGPQTVELALHSSNRFLTLVATDAGNHTHYDWILFGDPCIDVELNSK
jgi:hypothetical protein